MKASSTAFGIVVLLQIYYIHAQTCDQIRYTTINDIRRSTKFTAKSDSMICDRHFIKDDNWYRFDSVAGNTIPEHNPGTGVCGTFIPIWFKGTHPTQENVLTDASACAAIPYLPECYVSYDIKVIKCGSSYLYRLKEPKNCNLAYCAGKIGINSRCNARIYKLLCEIRL